VSRFRVHTDGFKVVLIGRPEPELYGVKRDFNGFSIFKKGHSLPTTTNFLFIKRAGGGVNQKQQKNKEANHGSHVLIISQN